MNSSSAKAPRSPEPVPASSKDAVPFAVAGALDLYSAPEVREALLARSAEPSLTVDLSGVETCDLAGLQLLLAAKRSAAAAGRSVRLRNPSAAVSAACEAVGIGVEHLSND